MFAFRYIINFLLDSTFGLIVIFVCVRICQHLAIERNWPSINFGEYGEQGTQHFNFRFVNGVSTGYGFDVMYYDVLRRMFCCPVEYSARASVSCSVCDRTFTRPASRCRHAAASAGLAGAV